MNKYYTIIIIALLVITTSVASFMYNKKEYFYSSDYYPKNIQYTSKNPNILSHGNIQKTLMQDGEYLYDYSYNLPNPFSDFQSVKAGVLFNEKIPKKKYYVLLGDTKESLQKIGELKRRGDGNHVFTIKTKKDYKVSCISIDDDIINCVNL